MLRTILGALCGYACIGLLIFGTDQIYTHAVPGFSAMITPPAWYFLATMATNTLYTAIGGWLCALISRRDLQATIGLIVIGEVMSVASVIYLWHTAPHFYSFYLLIVYPPAVWFGTRWGKPATAQASDL